MKYWYSFKAVSCFIYKDRYNYCIWLLSNFIIIILTFVNTVILRVIYIYNVFLKKCSKGSGIAITMGDNLIPYEYTITSEKETSSKFYN